MTKLETLHKKGKSIANHIKCSKCLQIKRDARVLNCLHIYCHKCVLNLRASASKGSPVHGFRAFCVTTGCTEPVSGKTTVVDPEIIEFLSWYDAQAPEVTETEAKLWIVNTALERKPDNADIKRKLRSIEREIQGPEQSGTEDGPCDLLQMAKLARKPY